MQIWQWMNALAFPVNKWHINWQVFPMKKQSLLFHRSSISWVPCCVVLADQLACGAQKDPRQMYFLDDVD